MTTVQSAAQLSGCAAALEQWHSRLEELLGQSQQETDDPQLRAKLIIEEAIEADEAIRDYGYAAYTRKADSLDHLRVAIAKELADVLYVVYGAARFFHIPLDAIFTVVHENNMTKLREGFELPPNGKVPKPPGYEQPYERIGKLLELFDRLEPNRAPTNT